MNIATKLSVVLATGFGLGLSPVASGTVGCFLGMPIVWFVWPLVGWPMQIILAAVLALVAVPICGKAEGHYGKKDDGRIVADEYLTFPICMIGLPVDPWVMAMAFVSNRFFDILKLPPAYKLQRLTGGVGIVIDDVLATFYSLAVNHAMYWFMMKYVL